MATNASQPATRRGFLDLPSELRLNVYEHVFCHPTVVKVNGEGRFELSAQLLATCHLIYIEGGAVLYGKNTFEIDINTLQMYDPGCFIFSALLGMVLQYNSVQRDMLPYVQRFSIRVRCPPFSDMLDALRDDVRLVVDGLQALPRPTIKFLRLHLDVYRNSQDRMVLALDDLAELLDIESKCIGMLRTWLGRLDNVEKVEIEGMPEEDADILRNRWQSKGQGSDMKKLLSLTEKYEALKERVGRIPICQNSLSRALLAVEQDDEVEFKVWKNDIFRRIKELWKELKTVEILKD